MTDFTKLVSSDGWAPLVEAGAGASYHLLCERVGDGCTWEQLEPQRQQEFCDETRAALSAFLTAAVDKGVAREAGGYTYANGTEWEACTSRAHEEFPVIIIKTGDK